MTNIPEVEPIEVGEPQALNAFSLDSARALDGDIGFKERDGITDLPLSLRAAGIQSNGVFAKANDEEKIKYHKTKADEARDPMTINAYTPVGLLISGPSAAYLASLTTWLTPWIGIPVGLLVWQYPNLKAAWHLWQYKKLTKNNK